MTFPFPIVTPYRGPASISFTAAASSESNLSSYTFSGQSIGAADPSRRIFVCVTAPANSNFGNITGVTIGGNAATQVSQIEDAQGFSDFAVYGLSLPTGTTADVVVTLSAAPDRLGIMVYAAYNLSSITPTSSEAVNTASTALSGTISPSGGGVALSMYGCENTRPSVAWTNATERHDGSVGTGGGVQSSAADAYASATSLSVTATPSSSQSRQGAIFLTFR